MASVSLCGVAKTYPNGVAALHPTDLAVEAGGRLALLGPSGSGKTTLLRLIAGLEDPDAGEIHVGGVRMDRLAPHKRGVALLPQRPALYPHLTVAKNLQTALGSASRLTVSDAADLLRLTPLLSRMPHELSGGERQRVGLAKLLVRGAGVWLLDEPFGPLDPVFRSEFRRDLHLLLDQTPATMILVTHDPIDATALGRTVGVLGEGRLQQLGTPEELRRRPAHRFVAVCLGRLSLIDGRVCGGERPETFVSGCGAVSVPLPDAIRKAATSAPSLTLGIRPEDVVPWSPDSPPEPSRPGAVLGGWPVVLAEPVGSGWSLTLARGLTRLQVEWPSGSPPPVGAQASWFLPADRCLWFDGPTGRRIDTD
jgi:multiple sugar transport system ATP-binding protein